MMGVFVDGPGHSSPASSQGEVNNLYTRGFIMAMLTREFHHTFPEHYTDHGIAYPSSEMVQETMFLRFLSDRVELYYRNILVRALFFNGILECYFEPDSIKTFLRDVSGKDRMEVILESVQHWYKEMGEHDFYT